MGNKDGAHIDTSDEEDPLTTLCIARFEDGKCVGTFMSYSSGYIKDFTRFCYYNPETTFEEKYN